MRFHYAYIPQSEQDPERFYVGHTDDLNSRLATHNRGDCTYTSSFRPWRIKTAIAFTNDTQALEFEHYLKSPSGRAFAKKRLQSKPSAAFRKRAAIGKRGCKIGAGCRPAFRR